MLIHEQNHIDLGAAYYDYEVRSAPFCGFSIIINNMEEFLQSPLLVEGIYNTAENTAECGTKSAGIPGP